MAGDADARVKFEAAWVEECVVRLFSEPLLEWTCGSCVALGGLEVMCEV